ncbi:penicillin-binding protein 2 [Zavarzinia aquatilis]|uniref:Penicillin-binding protein 2 n=2 Tax=Zavarzinia aquatilis TaxID=2211142 RepID=A0A317E5J6_9PROT|nr:penicillin-binding protein 2 [Zavarzinia aquatilis]PWR20275.1 penicillin-binding protein 2 [Zavarzinia aquatilis]
MLTRRALFLAGGQLAMLGVLAGRMYQLQVVDGDRYQMLAEDNRINLRLIAPLRGRILDRFGNELATGRQNFRVVLIREQSDDVDETLTGLNAIVPIPEHQLRRVRREMGRVRAFMPVTVLENLSWEEFAAINVHSPELPGIQPDVGETRYYPYGPELAHVIGYVSSVSDKDLAEDANPVLQLPGFKIGKNGVEKIFDENLRGKAGASQVEVNAYGRMIRELSRDEGQAGEDVTLALDLALQRFAYQALGEESGAAVVMDVHTGEVLVLASTPGYDPTPFNVGLSKTEWNALRNNVRNPLINKPIAGQYPPGSTFKMVVGLAALEAGVVGPGYTVFCPGSMQLGTHTFYCWKKGGHGTVDVQAALEQSCDCFFYDVARKVGIDRLSDFTRKFGLGEKLGIELPGEKPGLIPNTAWKERALKKPWLQGETVIAGIGQGYVLATPLQLATMTARLVNGGRAVSPRLAKAPPGAAEAAPAIDVDRRWLDLMLKGMNRVMNSPSGTAFRSRITEPGMQIGGKTGTSQVVRISRAERLSGVRRREQDKPWNERHHALFVGYGPVDNPRYACAVIIEHGGGGSSAAAPVASSILREAMRLDPLARTAQAPAEPVSGTAAPGRKEPG